MRSSPRLFAAALSALLLAPASASAAAAKKARLAPAPDATESEGKPASMGRDKAEIEAYLKQRLAEIRAGNKAQSDFSAAEALVWEEFWSKVKEERELFEVRVAKQRLNVFESLDSLERSEHGKTIADFERMQSNVLRSFENAQKAKMTAFFAAAAQRTKDFAAKQEKERAAFAADAEAGWRTLKAGFSPAPTARR